ncbi:MAG: DPP IV N-terminal domain-containing protein [Janthinobacterium lividum]
MRSIYTYCLSVLALATSAVPLRAQTPQHPSAAFREGVDALVNKHEYKADLPAGSQWLDGSTRYTALEPAAADPKRTDLVAYTTATGERRVLIPAAQLTPPDAKDELDIDDYAWSTDKQQLLLFANTQKVWRLNTRGDYWVLNLASGKLRKVGGDAPASSLMFAKFSPNGASVGYVYANNLYVEDVATGMRQRITTDGSTEIINGTTDWVTEEEFFLRDAFRWSPDSKSIAYLQFNQAGEGDYTLINDTKAEYPQLFYYRYPQAGTTNAAVRAGVVAATGGATKWLALPGDPRQNYIPRLEWVGGFAPGQLALEYLNRKQNHNDVYLFDTTTGKGKVFFTDEDKTWVEIMEDLRWLPPLPGSPSHDLLWLSERDGWRHAYRVSPNGKAHLLTDFPADVISLVEVDEAGGYLYFHASPDDAVRQYLYRVRLDGKGKPERMTPQAEVGFHRYTASPDGKVALHGWSTNTRPPNFSLVQLSDGKVLKQLATNDALATKAKTLIGGGREFFQVPVGDGVHLNGWMIKPPNFDPTKRYPVLVNVYGEPAQATVVDQWSGPLNAMIAREGYIIASFDNSGTPEPRGRVWRKSIYGAVGILSSQQQAAAIRELAKEHAYIDSSRLAVWGWSGGGSSTLNLMFRSPGLFRAGIAVAPVADERKYDTIYQERYMGLPAENVKGYHDGSPISFAEGLQDNLLVIHGSGDDNVHFQATELLINRLVEVGKPFDFMDYPNRTHAINEGPGTSAHLYNLIARYLEDHVPAGPR